MRIQIRSDSVEIEGYVNAVGRDSRPMKDRSTGERFVEQIVPGVFTRALTRNDVDLLLNHDQERVLGSTKTNLELTEDSIGLKARAIVTDKEVIEKARSGKLRGWSFGFYDRDSRNEDVTESERVSLDALKTAAVSYVMSYTGLSLEEIDNHEDISIAVLTLIADMYDNRAMTVDKKEVNRTAEIILSMHSKNLLPGGGQDGH